MGFNTIDMFTAYHIGKYRVSEVEVKILDQLLRIDFTCDTCNGHTLYILNAVLIEELLNLTI